ncbi:MAG: bifunctional nuclease domain-containing protein [Bacteroidota bacterium]|jgi:bifunctional DNase/RNase
MDKIKLEIAGLSYSQTQSGAYALVLAESGGNRQLPIIIGGFEAQAIAIELEKMTPTRPLTHDLFKLMALEFEITVTEILIYKLEEGIFFSRIICEQNEDVREIDARTSDAIAIGVRFNCPIYTFENILSSAGILMDENESDEDEVDSDTDQENVSEESAGSLKKLSPDELNDQLTSAIENEDYELASRIRDEIQKRTNH